MVEDSGDVKREREEGRVLDRLQQSLKREERRQKRISNLIK